MNISPDEAEEALIAIQKVTRHTQRSIASSGAFITLIITGIVWLIGFSATQFLAGWIVPAIWIAISIAGSAISILLGNRMGGRVHSPTFSATAKRALLFWLFLALLAIAVIAVARPTDGKQTTMMVVLFIMIGQMAMGLLLSFTTTAWALAVSAIALVGYFFFPGILYLWLGILGGGGMMALAFYIRARW
ncbi:MAG TPA: hypothetical protein VMC62_01195 [Longilinea sp.]|nr:hypothetical protein [Longilinea sp.]